MTDQGEVPQALVMQITRDRAERTPESSLPKYIMSTLEQYKMFEGNFVRPQCPT